MRLRLNIGSIYLEQLQLIKKYTWALLSAAILLIGFGMAVGLRLIKTVNFSGIPVPGSDESIAIIEAVLALALVPPAIRFHGEVSVRRILREQTIALLQIYPNIFSSAKSLDEALSSVIDLVEDPLRTLLKAFREAYRATGDIETAFQEVFGSAPRDVKLLLTSIVVAGRSGGGARDVLELTTRYALELDRMDYTISNRLKAYATITFIAVAVFGVAASVSLGLVAGLSGAPSIAAGATGLSSGTVTVSIPAFTGIMYYTLLILSLASAYVVAKSVDNYALKTMEYFIELSAIGTITLLVGTALLHV